jgi:parallel beta-helix repeat protein
MMSIAAAALMAGSAAGQSATMSAGGKQPAIPITGTKTTDYYIYSSGSFILHNDINRIFIQGSNVDFNLNNHSVTYVQIGAIDHFSQTPLVNTHVYNGSVISAPDPSTGLADLFGEISTAGSYGSFNNLNIFPAPSSPGIKIDGSPYLKQATGVGGNYNRVVNCTISISYLTQGGTAIILEFASHNSIENNTFKGNFGSTIAEEDSIFVVGDNTISGNHSVTASTGSP